MSFKDVLAAELEQISSRLMEFHEQAIAQVRREYRCTCARDAAQLSMHNDNPVRPASPRCDECESILLAIPAVGGEEDKAKEEETSAKEEAPPKCQMSGIGNEIPAVPGQVSAEPPLGELPVEKKNAVVQIDYACNLRDADNMLGQGSSDPYCICKVLGGAGAWEFRTRTDSNTQNPVWHHAEELVLDEDVSEYTLEFVVMDEDTWKPDDVLGWSRLPLASCYPEGFNSCLVLHNSRGALLQVSVEFVSDDSEQVAKMSARSREQWMVDDQHWQSEGPILTSTQTPTDFERRPDYLMTGSGVLDHFVIVPTDTVRLAWDVLSMCFILFDVFTVPPNIAFDLEQTTGMLVGTCIVTIYWTLDIVANFFTGFCEYGIVETRFRFVAHKYMTGWFCMDIVIVLADWVFIAIELGDRSAVRPANKFAKVGRAIKAFKLLSLIRARKISFYVPEVFRQFSEVAMILSHMFERLLSILILVHCIGCMWYTLGVADGETVTWVQERDIESSSFLNRYVLSLDWALAQFTPSPTDIHATNLRERIFKICVDFCGLVTFSSFVGTLTNRLARLRVLTAQRVENKMLLGNYFAENKVPIDLSRRVLKAVHAREQEQTSLQKCEHDLALLKGVPETLLQELRVQVKIPHFAAHPFFVFLHACDAHALYEACHKYLQDKIVVGGHELFLLGDQAQHMTFVIKGRVLYRRRGVSVNVEQGGWLSEASIWISGWTHRGVALASELGQLMTLDAVQFRGLMMSRVTWPDLYEKGIDIFIKAYVRSFLHDGEAAHCGTNAHLSCSDVWSEAKQLSIYCSTAFNNSGLATRSRSRSRVGDYLRKRSVSSQPPSRGFGSSSILQRRSGASGKILPMDA